MLKTIRLQMSRERLPDLVVALALFGISALLFSGLLIPLHNLIYRGDMPNYYAREAALRDGLAQGRLPLWNMYTTASLVLDPQSEVFYPGLALLRWVPQTYAFIWVLLIHIWLAGLGLYFLLREFRLRRSSALFAGIAYMLSGLVIARTIAGHMTFVQGAAWVPWLVLVYRRLLLKGGWLYYFLTVACAVCFVLGGHPQWVMIGVLPTVALGLLALAEAAIARQYRRFRDVLLTSASIAVLSFALLAVYLLPVGQYGSLTARGQGGFSFERAIISSVAPFQLATLTEPLAYTEAVTGPVVFHETMAYTGVVTLGLALLAVFSLDREQRKFAWLLAALAVIALLASLGDATPMYRLIFTVVKFLRIPGRFMFIWAFASTALAGIGLEGFLQRCEAGRATLGGLLWLSIAFALIGLAAMLVYHMSDQVDLASLPPGDLLGMASGLLAGWPTFQLALIVLGMWAAVLILRRWVPLRAWQWVMVAGILLDVGSTARQYALWKLEPSDYLDIFFNDANPFRRLQVDPSQARLWGPGLSPNSAIGSSFGFPVILRDQQGSPYYLRQLATLYKNGDALSAAEFSIRAAKTPPKNGVIVKQVGNLYLVQSADNLPRVYATGAVRVERSLDLTWQAVSDPNFEPLRQTVVLDPAGELDGLPEAVDAQPVYHAAFSTYSPDRLVIRVSADRPVMVVVIEPFYPGWSATLDGQPAVIWQVNHAFRGVVVGGGEHTIEMVYKPASFFTGLWISLASLGLTVIAAVWLAVRRWRKAQPSSARRDEG